MTKTKILKRKLLGEQVKNDILKNLHEEGVLTFFSKCANIEKLEEENGTQKGFQND